MSTYDILMNALAIVGLTVGIYGVASIIARAIVNGITRREEARERQARSDEFWANRGQSNYRAW